MTVALSSLWRRFFGPGVAHVSPRDAHERLSRVLVLDVREQHEFRAGHIPGAVHVPLRELRRRIRELQGKEDVITVCRSGNRSRAAAKLLASEGYRVENLRGGMIAWTRERLPVRTGKGRR